MTYEVAASINYLSNCIWAFNDFSVNETFRETRSNFNL